eukprot:COSAG03_NODE_3746_length_1849_cov_22.852571_2_plen_154_part_00
MYSTPKYQSVACFSQIRGNCDQVPLNRERTVSLPVAPAWTRGRRPPKLVKHGRSKHPAAIQVAAERLQPRQRGGGVVDAVVRRVSSRNRPGLSRVPNAPRRCGPGRGGAVWLRRPVCVCERESVCERERMRDREGMGGGERERPESLGERECV